MSPDDRQRLKILMILIAVLALTIWIGQRIYEVEVPAGLDADTLLESDPTQVPTGSIRELEALEGPVPVGPQPREVNRNPFQYGPAPAPPPVQALPLPSEVRTELPRPPPPGPPPAPPIPFEYSGYARVSGLEPLQALLFGMDRVFAVVEGDVLVGRYRVLEVTQTEVVLEDLEFGRTQRLPLAIQ